MKTRLRIGLGAAALCAALFAAPNARASLTPSEEAQLRAFVAAGHPENAPRARSLVARTDLSLDESTQALTDAFVPVAFGESHVAFARDLLFGGASSASRPLLGIAVTRALVARADAVLSRYAADLAENPRALEELSRIYRFLDAEVANAGIRHGAAHEPSSGIPPTSYAECVKALAEHVEHNPRWLKGDAAIPAAAVHVRGQLQLALVDMMNDTPTRLVDAATKLGLTGARRKMLVERGVLIVDAGKADDAHVERARAIFDRLFGLAPQAGPPGLRPEAEALAFGDDGTHLAARAAVLTVKTPLEGGASSAPDSDDDEVEPGPVDPLTLDVARDLAIVAVRRALDARPDLRVAAERDSKAAGDAKLGRATDASLEAQLAAAIAFLLTDAPRAMDLAFVRFLSREPAGAAVLSDALGVLAAPSPQGGSAPVALTLGKPRGTDGATESLPATNVKLAPNGAVTAFTVGGHAWAIARDAGPVTGVTRDGLPLALSMLASARVPALGAASWAIPGFALARMSGAPRAGIAPGQGPGAGVRVRLVGTGGAPGERGYDAAATVAPGADVVVDADLAVKGDTAGIAVRAAATQASFRGAALMLTPAAGNQPARIALVLREEDGFESFLAAPHDLPQLGPMHVRLAVRGTKVEATAGGVTMRGTIPSALARGEVAVFARKGATIEATGFRVGRQ